MSPAFVSPSARPVAARFLALSLASAALCFSQACANSTFNPDDAGGTGEAGGGGGGGGGADVGKSGGAGSTAKAGAGGGGTAGAGATAGKAGASGKGGAAGKAGAGGIAGTAGIAGESGASGTANAGGGGSAGKGGSSGAGGSAGKGGSSGGSGSAGKGGSSGVGGGGAAGQAATGGSAGAGGQPNGLCVYAPSEDVAKDDACFACWNAAVGGDACKTQREACDADCEAFFQCVVSCPREDSQCEKSCDTSLASKGKALYEALATCAGETACKTECAPHVSELLSLDMCKHDVCTTGMILYSDCSPAAAVICEEEAACCGGLDPKWSAFCVQKAEDAGFCPQPGCIHEPCAPGAPILDKTCSPCVSAICDQYPLCCSPLGKWDATCANAVATVCAAL